MERITVKISDIRQLTPTIKAFTLDLQGQNFDFLPGQWLDLYVSIDGRDYIGGYSLTSSPDVKDSVEIAVKYSNRSPVTKYLYENLKINDNVEIYGGQGDCTYEPEMGSDLVLIAGGIGITPFMSIIRYVSGLDSAVKVSLVYSAVTPDEFAYKAEIDAIAKYNKNFSPYYTVTGKDLNWTGNTSRINQKLLKSYIRSAETVYYICGPQNMIDDTVSYLLTLGVSNKNIKYEKWW